MGVLRKNFELEPLHPEDLELEEELADIRLNLMKENQRLKAQLDREIHINRKMKRALEKYANRSNWSEGSFMTADEGIVKADEELAQQTLKQREEME